MTSQPALQDPTSADVAVFQAGKVALRSRTEVSFMAAVGAMVIGILLAVAFIIGAAPARSSDGLCRGR